MLTVKDFILYNNPCRFCQKPIELLIRSNSVSNSKSITIKNPNLDANTLDMDLKITYNFSLNLKINHTHNRFISNNSRALTEYLKEYKISFMLQCPSCGTRIKSGPLQFDLDKLIIKPLVISNEYLNLWNDGTFYSVATTVSENKSILTATTSGNTTVLNLPLQPLKKFKTPKDLLKKMKTLLLFT